MIDSSALLADLQRLLPKLEADISSYAKNNADSEARLKQQYTEAKDAERTAEHWVDWRAALITQSAVAWVLACVFTRFLEDNQLIKQPIISGPKGKQLNVAKDALTVYFRENPTHAEREYLHHQFDTLCNVPVMASLLDKSHNPLWTLPVSADGAKLLLDFFQKLQPETGEIVHDFTDDQWNTRFLGDLYQDLSESVRKRYALLQTPDFVESFILDYTLKPAMEAFGLKDLRMIDPTCGSGHFLLSGFTRVFDAWLKKEPQTNTRELAQRALSSMHGIDINPYAVAIARFRLLIAAMQAAGSTSIHQTPDFQFNLAVGDSLIHGKRHESGGQGIQTDALENSISHVLDTEDRAELVRILGQRFHVVVGNPPYIVVRDKALNQAYRDKYTACHRQYSLGVPFTERFFDLTIQEPEAGYLGMITTNSFMKREFGKKLIEEYLPNKDLTHVIDTSGAYIPGHGTPTVILYARNRKPLQETVRTVLGIRGEPSTPVDPAAGKVWSAIVSLLNDPGNDNEFVSSANQRREIYNYHPWSIGGGGASELKIKMESISKSKLENLCSLIGFVCMTRADDVYFSDSKALKRSGLASDQIKITVEGNKVRDWSITEPNHACFPYNAELKPELDNQSHRYLWPYRTGLWLRREPNGNHREIGLSWFQWSRFQVERYKQPLSIAFAEVASHNHFVLDRGGKVFNRTSPVIKLAPNAKEKEHLSLLGLLNSSIACFWIKQVFQNKGEGADAKGARQTGEAAFNYYQISCTGLTKFPITELHSCSISALAGEIDRLAGEFATSTPSKAVLADHGTARDRLKKECFRNLRLRHSMLSLQEELDWVSYSAYSLIDRPYSYKDDLPNIAPGERAFEIVLARKMERNEISSSWFVRHRIKPCIRVPNHWPEAYQLIVQERIEAIENNKWIRLIEQPEYKRRWASDSWDDKVAKATREYLLDAIEDQSKNYNSQLHTAALLANQLQSNTRFQQVAEIYTGTNTFNLQDLVTDLIADEQVPQMATARYKAKGMTKFRAWQETWDLQRREDAGEPLDIPVPPKYASSDFAKAGYWKHRGKLDVPKERFFSLPACEKPGDSTPVIGWAGLDHLQRAQAIASWYMDRKEQDGWQGEQLMPMLAALEELIPWLKQWHNDLHPEYNERMGDFYASFLAEELHSQNLSIDDVLNWQPPAPTRRTRKASTKKKASKTKKTE